MLIYGYIRQSSAEQVRYGYNLDEQERQIKEYCECHFKDQGYELKIYVDAGKSGTNMKRSELQKLLSDSKRQKPNIVIFHNIDRLSRELSDLWSMIKFFTKHDIRLLSIVSYIDLNSAYGIGNVLNEGLSAMIESMKISDRTIRAYKEAVKQGKYPFAGSPRGYKKINKHLFPSEIQKDIDLIHYIFNFFVNNKGTKKVLKKELKSKYGFNATDGKITKLVCW